MASGRTDDDLDPAPDEFPHGAPRRTSRKVRAGAPAGAPGEIRVAAAVVCLQAVGLLAAMVVLLVKTITGHPDSLGRALLAGGFALAGAALLLFAARSIVALRPGLRSPLVVLELLVLPVGWSLGFQAGRMGYAAPMLLSALAVLYLLFTPAGRHALERQI